LPAITQGIRPEESWNPSGGIVESSPEKSSVLFDGFRLLFVSFDDLVDQTLGCGILCRHKEIAIGIFGDLFESLPGVFRQDLVEFLAHQQDLF